MTKISLQCRECKKEYASTFKYICDECFGPLDVKYEFPTISKNTFSSREHTYWRYFELLPIESKSNIVSIHAGMTPLIKAEKLGKELGLDNLYIKNDSVNPTFSFKDRPAGVAVSKAKEFGLSAVGCASTGNLASATAAHAAKGGFPCYVFAPSDIEHAKIAQALAYGSKFIAVDGTYDDANRIAAQIGDSKGIGIVNINMRSYYVEGSKTLAYEVAEQLGWQVPDQLVVPVGSGAMLNAICKGFEELQSVSLLGDVSAMHVHAAQPHGCAPIVDAFKNNTTEVTPVENPDTIAKSLAIGDPGDGRYVLKRLKQYRGYAEESNNKEILDAILLLAKTEGIFTEPAGGVSVAVLKKMVEDGKIDKNDTTICYVTGNGLKATESLMEVLSKPEVIQADLAAVSAVIQ
ncbi:MAG TPA: threonine synthase [Candidatus Nitrosotenuis sp.]|nr:threonine synthase [Candidatus Nitrosotenuis sp.]